LGSWWCRFSLTSGWFWWCGFVLNENKNKVQIKTWKTLALNYKKRWIWDEVKILLNFSTYRHILRFIKQKLSMFCLEKP
jgi:hypothetical protein